MACWWPNCDCPNPCCAGLDAFEVTLTGVTNVDGCTGCSRIFNRTWCFGPRSRVSACRDNFPNPAYNSLFVLIGEFCGDIAYNQIGNVSAEMDIYCSSSNPALRYVSVRFYLDGVLHAEYRKSFDDFDCAAGSWTLDLYDSTYLHCGTFPATITLTAVAECTTTTTSTTSTTTTIPPCGDDYLKTTAGSDSYATVAGHTYLIETWGGGGAGRGSASGTNRANGGGAGAYSAKGWVSDGSSLVITVGAGGTGSTGNGTAGGDSTVTDGTTTLCMAKGGGAGVTGSVGAGGTVGSGIGDSKFSGGDGGTGASDDQGGGGGSSGGPGNNGNNGDDGDAGGAGGVAVFDGGSGGDGGLLGNGQNGISPGGGGGGADKNGSTTRTGGNGADGQVRITCVE